MRIKLNFFSIALIGLIALSNYAFAQRGVEEKYASPLDPSSKPTAIYVGPCAGFNIMGHSMDIPTFFGDNLCPNFKNATGIGFFGGLTFEYLFGDVSTSSSSLIVRAMYNMFPGSVTVTDNEYPVYDISQDRNVNSLTEGVMDIDYNAVTVEVMYKINPIPNWGLGIVVGPSVDYLITKNRSQKMNILEPLNAVFPTDTQWPDGTTFDDLRRSATLYDGEIEETSAIRLGLKAGVQYEILLSSSLYIAPSVAYNFGITSVSSRYTWRVSPLQIGLDARFVF